MAFSRQVDLLSVCRNPLASSLELKDYSTWLAQRPRLARPGTPLWTVVQTEPAPSVIEQAAELSGRQARSRRSILNRCAWSPIKHFPPERGELNSPPIPGSMPAT